MDQKSLEALASNLGLGLVRYYPSLGSTNDIAASWAEDGAPDLSLVIADEQIKGKGRAGRRWITPPGSALAFSLILSPTRVPLEWLSRLTGLGALAVKQALESHYGLPARIKWPNDVLLLRHKAAGVLVEAHWTGSHLKALILGIGINVASESVSELQQLEPRLHYPATCIEQVAGFPVDRVELLGAVLSNLLLWLPRVAENDFLQAWEASLEFRGEWVQVGPGETLNQSSLSAVGSDREASIQRGKLLGLCSDGSIRLLNPDGETVVFGLGEIRLRKIT